MALAQPDIDYLLNECRIKLPGSSDTGIKQELWGVIKEFLQDTNSWIEHQQLMVIAGQHEYRVAPRRGGQIVRLIGVLDGNLFPVNASMPQLGVLSVHRRIDVSSIMVPIDDHSTSANHPWKFAIIKNIKFPATKDDIPDAPAFVLQVYSGTIVDGVLGKMMMQQSKTWTNLALAKYHLQRFRDGIGIARSDIWNQNLQGGQRWRFPTQFATHSQRMGSVATFPAETF